MSKRSKIGFFVVFLLTLTVTGMVGASAAGPQTPAAPVSTAFIYQGNLTDNGTPASGAYDLRFSLFDAASGGVQVGNTFTRDDLAVTGGLFNTSLDFGVVFNGQQLWLAVEVRPGASTGSYTTLVPRIAMSGVPYALGIAPGAVVDSNEADVPAITLGAPNANTSALVTTGNANGYGVIESEDQSATGGYGVFSRSDNGIGVYGESYTATGVYGFGQTGVYGQGDYAGVQGSGPIGLFGSSTSGNGVYAYTETGQEAVIGRNLSTAYGARGVFGEIHSTQPGGSSSAVLGVNNGTGASGIGVWGSQDGTGYGVLGETLNGGYAVVGDNGGSNTSGYAGSFNGRVAVVGTLTKGGGSFKIDHPLDPANKYLYHSFVESPDMKNIYDGVVTLDENGRAVVTMPDWFEALNQNFRYQLTAIGASMPDLYVSEKISDNHFAIAGGQPGGEVSWQVTGIRHDPFAEAYRIPVEEDKTGSEKGHYLYPEVYGKSVQDSVWYASSPNARYNIDHPEGPQQPDLNDPLGQ